MGPDCLLDPRGDRRRAREAAAARAPTFRPGRRAGCCTGEGTARPRGAVPGFRRRSTGNLYKLPAIAAARPRRGGMPHALIVDDEPDVVAWMSEVVKAEGYTVATADSLRNARAQLVRQTPDVLLTDLQLPDGRGTDLVPDLESPQQTEVVVITGHASIDSAIEAVRIGASDYLVKPV